MKHSTTLLFYLSILWIALFSTANAATINCNKPLNATETTTCEDITLHNLDEQLDRTYSTVLGQKHNVAALKKSQRNWLAIRNACKAEAPCIEDTYQNRLAQLEAQWQKNKTAINNISKHKPNSAIPFEGQWQECFIWKGEEICTGYIFLQSKKQVCGVWDYWATGVTYSGQLVAEVSAKNKATITHICGTPGSDTQQACGDDAAKPTWEATHSTMQVCNTTLMIGDKTTCTSGQGYTYAPLSKQQRLAFRKQAWVKSCLNGQL
jgi:uncharacterized protein